MYHSYNNSIFVLNALDVLFYKEIVTVFSNTLFIAGIVAALNTHAHDTYIILCIYTVYYIHIIYYKLYIIYTLYMVYKL